MTMSTLNDVTQATFDQAEATVISLLRSAYPALDLRRGTVLREILVRPASAFYALEDDRYNQLRLTRSLTSIAQNPDAATADDVNHILANFNITTRVGSTAHGTALIKVRYDRSYYIPSTFVLEASGGIQYRVEQAYTVSSDSNASIDSLPLYGPGADQAYYFMLPVVALVAGEDSDITAGTALDATVAFDGFITAEAYTDFLGGTDAETVDELIARLPAAISNRSLDSRRAIEAILRSPDGGNFDGVLQALSVQGYGDAGQLRDKHNASGVATGGKVDIYVRTFQRPATTVLRKTGTLIAPNTYQFTLSRDEAPGFYAIRMVTDADVVASPVLDFENLPVVGSYDIVDARSTSGLTASIHDIDMANALVETAGTIYQTSTITVNHVSTGGGATHDFRVEIYVAPALAQIQDYVDEDTVRNVKADHLIRCPFLCLVGVRATVVAAPGAELNISAMQIAVADYINSRSFVTELTESEIIGVLHQFPIMRVDTSSDQQRGFVLQGILRDAAGAIHQLEGHTLDIAAVSDADCLLLPATCVFAAHTGDIIISVSAT
jgi:hypothetical protein